MTALTRLVAPVALSLLLCFTVCAADSTATDVAGVSGTVTTPTLTLDEWYRCLTFSNMVYAGMVLVKGPRESLDKLDSATPTTLIESIVSNKHPVRVKTIAQTSSTRRDFEMELLDKVMKEIISADDDQSDVKAFRQFALAMIDHRCVNDTTLLHVDPTAAYVIYTPSEANYKFPQGQKPPFVRYDFNNAKLFWKLAQAMLVEMQKQ
jgi:hypothetical protein